MALSLLLAAGLLAWLFWRMDARRLAETVRGCDARWLLAAGAGAAAYWLVRLGRWRWMTRLAGAEVSWGVAARSMLAGLGIGLLTPMRGGEIVRPMFVPPGARMQLAGYVVLERCFDLLAVLLLAVPGLSYLVATGVLGPWAAWMAGGLAAAVVLPVALLAIRPHRLFMALMSRLPRKLRPLALLPLPGRVVAVMLAVSLLAEAASIFTVYLCFRGLGPFSLATAYGFVPLVMLNNLLPLTPGGLGVRETIAKYVFRPLGYADTLVVTGYLVNTAIVLLVPGAIGLVFASASRTAELKNRGQINT